MTQQPANPELIVQNQDRKRFEWNVDGHLAFSEYIHVGERFFITHTEVPPALEGRGIGSQLILHLLQWIEAHKLQLVPLCPFTAAYLQRHPEWKRLLAPGFNV